MFLDKVVEKCHINLLQPTAKIPLAYLISRGLTLNDIKKYKIGYTGNVIPNIDPEEHEDAPAFNKWLGTRGKFVKGRIVFPIHDELGNAKGIETRGLDQRAMDVLKPKYKTALKPLIDQLPDSTVRYKKFYLEKVKNSAFFFGLPHNLPSIWETRTAFLTEGIMDLISLEKAVPNVVSPLTANINEFQLDWLKRYVDKVILVFDSDEKGKVATYRIKKELEPEGISVFSIGLKSSDVNDYIMKYGVSELKMTIQDKMDYFF